jgi:hypothetical protein
VRLLETAAALLLLAPASAAAMGEGPCGTEADGSRHLLALHRYRRQAAALGDVPSAPPDRDQDHVAVLQDRGDLVVRKNPFDLDGAALRFAPNRAGGYDVALLALALEPPGPSLRLGDDEAREVELPFAFPFYGTRYTRVFVHADGSLTFGAADAGPGERGMARFLSGPPRVAPFFADLDPSRGGSVSVRLSADRVAIAWSGVPGRGQINRNSFQATLLAGGELELVYGTEMQTREAIVGLSPGGTFSAARPTGSTGALLERFSETERLDLVSAVRRFYTGHPDFFQQVVVYTGRPLNPLGGSLAFEVNVKNEARGIGLDLVDDAAQWGSAGRLESVVFMDSIDPYLEVDGFEILGHEVGHRWLARLRFRDTAGAQSPALLGRGGVHWSFFLDADASLVDGNDIVDRGGGRFESVDIARRFSPLDQYAMGLRLPAEVPPFFYVEAADDFRPNRPYRSSSAPEAGVSFTGLRRDVRIEDVVAAMGPRVPDATRAPRLLRQAYVLVADERAPATAARLRAVARIRSRFEAFYRDATDGRGVVDSTLP